MYIYCQYFYNEHIDKRHTKKVDKISLLRMQKEKINERITFYHPSEVLSQIRSESIKFTSLECQSNPKI